MKIGINGFGRIGRAIYRVNMANGFHFEIPVVNDINPDPANIGYQLNYDTTYGNLEDKFVLTGTNSLANSVTKFEVECHTFIDEVDWNSYGVEIVVDASGKKDNLFRAKNVIAKNKSVKKVVITHSPKEVDFTMVIGANDNQLKQEYDVISSSICDATAMAPVLRLMYDNFKIDGAAITTVHPLLSYQNVLDGASVSWFDPSQTYTHYALGRSVFNNIIPKPTTAVDATYKVLGLDPSKVGQFSYRTPNTIVASADITLFLGEDTTEEAVTNIFKKAINTQKMNILTLNYEPLNSLDMKGSPYSAIIDARWLTVTNGRIVKLVLWYDNEWGYSSRVNDQLKLVENMIVS